MAGEFQHGLFGCFDNMALCVVTFFAPCYTAGRVAEKVGGNCLLHGCLFVCCPLVSLFCMCNVRGKVRQARKIDGSQCGDCCIHLFCTSCALCQEGQEVNALDQTSMAAAACDEPQDIERE